MYHFPFAQKLNLKRTQEPTPVKNLLNVTNAKSLLHSFPISKLIKKHTLIQQKYLNAMYVSLPSVKIQH